MRQPDLCNHSTYSAAPSPFPAIGTAQKRPRLETGNDAEGAGESIALPQTVDALMEQIGANFDSTKKMIADSFATLLENSVRERLKPMYDELTTINARVEQLQRGTETARQKFTCLGCNAEEREVVFTSCRHLLFCVFCASKYSSCPQCGVAVSERSKITIDRVDFGDAGEPAGNQTQDEEGIIVKKEEVDE